MDDRRLVQLALDRRFLTIEQVEQVKREQLELLGRGLDRTVWSLLRDRGLVSEMQEQSLLKFVSTVGNVVMEVDGYALQARIGAGGMGEVYRGRNAKGEDAAIKLLSPKLAGSVENARRFQREARASLRLRHPHVTRSLSAGETGPLRYLVMELVKGLSLKQWLIEYRKMSEDQVLVLLWQMASALDYVWGCGVLHRDVKPANIILGAARAGVDEPFCAKLCDFGLVRVWQLGSEEIEAKGRLTAANVAVGTPHYMAPEQALGESNLDQRADIYSLGASLYHALLGHTMHSGKTSTVIMYKQVTENADMKPLLQSGLSPGVVQLIGRMLSRERKQRFTSWTELLAELTKLAPAMVAVQERALAKAMEAIALEPMIEADDDEDSAQVVMPRIPVEVPAQAEQKIPASPPTVAIQTTPSRKHASSTRRVRARRSVTMALAALVVIALAALAFLVFGRSGALHATPANFAVVLAAAEHGAKRIVLGPGDYQGPWDFAAAESGLVLRAAGPGVRLVGRGVADDAPLLRLDAGLKDFRLEGITLAATSGLGVEARSGAQATLRDLTIAAPIRVIAAELRLVGLRLQGAGITIEAGGRLWLDDGVVTAPRTLDLQGGEAELHRCRLEGGASAATGAGELVRAQGGKLDLDAITMAASPSATGLVLLMGASCSLRDVLIERVAIGISVESATIARIDGLTVSASQIGLRWSGPVMVARPWDRLALHAPQAVIGVNGIDAAGAGARPERLALVPPAMNQRP